MTRGAWHVTDYDTAKSYLSGGHKKWDRPLYVRGLRVQSRSKDIAIVDKWYNFEPILFHPDGTLTIQAPQAIPNNWGGTWNPLRSQGVRRNFKDFSGLQGMFQKNGTVYITTQDASRTPSKIQKCRTCHGLGLVDSWCSPSYCSNPFPCEEHPEFEEPAKNRYGSWHYGKCLHGNSDSHNVPKSQDCYHCKGVGLREYGNNLISIAWDGSPIRLKDGNLVKQPPTELEKRIAAYVKLDS
jgi:hypothetical protein